MLNYMFFKEKYVIGYFDHGYFAQSVVVSGKISISFYFLISYL